MTSTDPIYILWSPAKLTNHLSWTGAVAKMGIINAKRAEYNVWNFTTSYETSYEVLTKKKAIYGRNQLSYANVLRGISHKNKNGFCSG